MKEKTYCKRLRQKQPFDNKCKFLYQITFLGKRTLQSFKNSYVFLNPKNLSIYVLFISTTFKGIFRHGFEQISSLC